MTVRLPQPAYRRLLIPLMFFVLLTVPIPVLANSGTLVIGPDQHVFGDIATVSQPIEIAGIVDGDVTSWSGDIAITGRVNGDVVSYVGKVSVAAGAHVGGSIMSIGGSVERHAQAQVARAEIGGSQNATLTSLVGLMLPRTQTMPTTQPAIGSVIPSIIAALLLSALTLLWGAFWPNRTLASAITLRVFPAHALIVGVLATITLLVLIPFLFGLLAASVLGLPLVVVVLLIITVPYIYGLAATSRFIALAQRPKVLSQSMLPPIAITFVVAVAVAVAFATALSPIVGLTTFYLLASPGLGAVLLSRGGLLMPYREVGSRG